MNLRHYLLIVFSFFFLLEPSAQQKKKVALLMSNPEQQSEEYKSLTKLFDKHANEISYKIFSLNEIEKAKKYDVIWFHRPDTSAFSGSEIKAGKILKSYAQNGGQLILSMEAVRLLNHWNVEPTTIQTSYFDLQDGGFGRKLGFHGYREHPVFDGLFGGAYTWHGKEDNRCRILGFFDQAKPQANGTKVIGTLWEYIFYHPTDKVLWETPLGKGRVLAIGCCLYYGRDNFNKEIEELFTLNCIRYLCGDKTQSKEYYWRDIKPGVIASNVQYQAVSIPKPQKWAPSYSKDHLKWKASNTYFDIATQRSLVVCKEKGGIEEIWSHPFLSMRDFRVRLRIANVDTLVVLDNYTPQIELSSNAAIRTYQIGNVQLKEIITGDIHHPAVVVHYEWNGNDLKEIVTDYKSNLRLMWPYDESALGEICYQWSDELNAFLVHDSGQEFCFMAGADVKGQLLAAGQYDNFIYSNDGKVKGVPTNKLQTASSVSYNVRNDNALDIVMASGCNGVRQMVELYADKIANAQQIYTSSAAYYDDYLTKKLQITTPDTVFNEGFKWAQISTAQFIVETPGLGTSVMAGYSSSRRGWGGGQKVSGRPGYAWYFGRDAVFSGFAFDNVGDFRTVRNILEMFIRYQQVDGKIYHELTSSGSLHFDASDATPLFVNLMAHYLRSSGDLDFVRENQRAIHKAMDYCYSTDTNGDHLIENTNVGHGWLEGGELYGSQTEFYLAGIWNAALNDAAYLSEAVNDLKKAEQYQRESKIVNTMINRDFWNTKGYYNYGKKGDGSYTDELIILPAIPVYFGVTDSAKASEMVQRYASSDFSADWGVRMIDDGYTSYSPSAYQSVNVWPLFTGFTALAEYKTERYLQGYSHIMGNLLNYKGFSQGRVPEVIDAFTYKSSGITLHQCWSETMVLQPVIEGLLGFSPNALDKSFQLAPRFPFDWNSCEVQNLYVGGAQISFKMKKEGRKIQYSFRTNQPVKVHFSPALAMGTAVKNILINGESVNYTKTASPEYVIPETTFELKDRLELEINMDKEGASALASVIIPEKDKQSSGFRVLRQDLKENILTVTVEGRPGTVYPLDASLPNGYKQIENGKNPVLLHQNVYRIEVPFMNSNEKYIKKQVKIILN